MRMWPEQLQRVERYYAKIRNIVDHTMEPLDDPNLLEIWYDEFLAFFLHCYHLKDWLACDDKYRSCEQSPACEKLTCTNCYIKPGSALDVCGGIANGIKHLILDKDPKRRRFMVGRGFNHPEHRGWFYIVALDKKAEYPFTRQMEYRDHGDSMEIADAAVSAWRAFVQRGEGISSEDEYRQWLAGGCIPWYEFKRDPSKETPLL